MGSEMCIRDRRDKVGGLARTEQYHGFSFDMGGHRFFSKSSVVNACLLYTSDAADDLLRVDLGGRRTIKNKKPLTDDQPEQKS